MKISCALLLCGFAGSSLFSVSGHAQAINVQHPERMVENIDRLVKLTPEQKARVTVIATKTANALLAAPAEESVRTQMRREIRALLTPEQQRLYDRTPQINGGGLTLPTPENKVARLDALVSLTALQKVQATAVFVIELEDLLAIPEAERMRKGAAIRQTARREIRALLTPEQRAKFDRAPQSQGGNAGAPK